MASKQHTERAQLGEAQGVVVKNTDYLYAFANTGRAWRGETAKISDIPLFVHPAQVVSYL
jgi:hypothetical protein